MDKKIDTIKPNCKNVMKNYSLCNGQKYNFCHKMTVFVHASENVY